MPRFRYSAYSSDGKLQKGDLVAGDASAALKSLRARGLTPVEIMEGKTDLPWWRRDFSLTGKRKGLSDAELSMLFSSLASLARAQFPLAKALKFTVSNAKSSSLRLPLERMLEQVEDGSTLAHAMRQEESTFPMRFIAMINLGEKSNSLPSVLENISQALREQIELKREIRGAMIYPAILLAMSVAVMGLLLFYLVPTLKPVFASANADLPVALAVMDRLKSALVSGWPAFLLCFAVLLILLLRAGQWRTWLEPLLLRLPWFGRHIRERGTLALCQALELMLSSGASLSQALQTAETTATSSAFRNLISDMSSDITNGGKLSDSLKRSDLIDPMSKNLLISGEESNHMSVVLTALAQDLKTQSHTRIKESVKLITPLMTLIIGGGVGTVLLSTISAIMDLNDIAF